MRHFHLTFWMLACSIVAVSASSCSATFGHEAEVEDEFETLTTHTKKITFGMQTTMEGMTSTRAVGTPEYLLVMDVQPDGGVKVFTRNVAEETNVSGAALDNLSLELVYGTHKLYFLAADSPFSSYDQDLLTVLWDAGSGATLKGCWATSVEVTVDQGTLSTQPIVMPIRVANIIVVLNDGFSQATTEMVMNLTGGSWQFDLKQMSGCAATPLTRRFNVSGQPKEKAGSNLGFYTFIPAGAENVGTLTVAANDATGQKITSHVMTDVLAQVAHITKYMGLFYSNNQDFTLQVANEWTTDNLDY